MNILLIDNYDSFTYNLVHYLEQFATHVEVIRNDQLNILSVANYDKIMISPGPGLPADSGCIMEVLDKYHPIKPIFGICLWATSYRGIFWWNTVQYERSETWRANTSQDHA